MWGVPGLIDEIVVDGAVCGWEPGGAWSLAPGARGFREELGLPVDRPVVMTGHQPVFWHAGILAKYLAVEAVAAKTGAAAAWCVPDQDVVDAGAVAWPAAVEDGERAGPGRWERVEGRVLSWGGGEPSAGVSVGLLGAGEVVEDVDGMPAGLAGVVGALRGVDGESSAARRVWAAHARVMGERLGMGCGEPVAFATGVARTGLFARLVERMREDPMGCAGAYNAAVAAEPGVGMRALAVGDGRVELPLWRAGAGGRRAAVYAADLEDGLEAGDVLPRASLFTGLMRLAGCDLFVHGTGGIGYDRVTERWFADWLGEAGDVPGRLCSAGVVTATVLLDLGVPDVTRADLARAVWRARAGRHRPGLIGDEAGQREKDELVRRIDGAAYGSDERAGLFAELRGMLDRVRGERAGEIAALDGEVERVRAGLADRAIARDRTWPWVLHDDQTLGALRAGIVEKVGG